MQSIAVNITYTKLISINFLDAFSTQSDLRGGGKSTLQLIPVFDIG